MLVMSLAVVRPGRYKATTSPLAGHVCLTQILIILIILLLETSSTHNFSKPTFFF